MTTLVDPKNITIYNRTDSELQIFWLFCILVAGKNSDTTSRLLTRLLSIVDDSQTPFEALQNLGKKNLYKLLLNNKTGQYDRIHKAILQSLQLDLRNCSRDELMNIYGVGPKTARFFLLHTREFCEEIVLDTHILRWMREKYHIMDVPRNTPQNIDKYETWAKLCRKLMTQHYPNLTLAQIDLKIWTEMSGRLSDV
jgi:thermostable 8-oxoguanine DNA glycosylase